MKCEDFQMLLADALGGELSDADRPAFEAHTAQCPRCRAEYESMSGAVRSLQALPEPQPVSVRRIGDNLILGVHPDTLGVHPDTPLPLRGRGQGEGVPGRTLSESSRGTATWFSHRLLRYAASVLIAFTAGYALRSTLAPRDDASGRPVALVANDGAKRGSLEGAIAGAHLRNPTRSDLAKCLIAMYDVRR